MSVTQPPHAHLDAAARAAEAADRLGPGIGVAGRDQSLQRAPGGGPEEVGSAGSYQQGEEVTAAEAGLGCSFHNQIIESEYTYHMRCI